MHQSKIWYVAFICAILGPQAWSPLLSQNVPQRKGPSQAARPSNATNSRTQNQAAARRRNPPREGTQPGLAPPELKPAEEQWMDRLLAYWERTSSGVQTYQCKFARFEYDPVFGPRDPKLPKTISHGEVRYAAPDRGVFRVDTTGRFVPAPDPGGKPSWPQRATANSEHWVCDGKSVFEYNESKKQLIESRLPPELQGKAITDGPLPFLFGAKAEKLKQRYWFKPVPNAQGVDNQYQFIAFPKRREDAANFQRVEVILDKQMFLPIALQLYPPNFDPQKNTGRTVYSFSDRKVNDPVHKVKGFMNAFVRPKLPSGWQHVTENYGRSPQPMAGRPPANKTR